MRKKEKAQEDKEAEKSQEVTDSDGVITKEMLYHWAQDLKREAQPLSLKERAELEDAWRQRKRKHTLSLKYFPEADPRHFREYGMEEYRKETEQREKAIHDAKNARSAFHVFDELFRKCWDRAVAKFCHSKS